MTLLLGDSLERLKELPDNSVDSVVTDPPAGISFMSKGWDSDKGGRDQWIKWLEEIMREVYRVMKPGAHGFVWAIPRTSHWTGMALENAGFRIKDSVCHIFGSGFPKSHNLKGEWSGWGSALKPAAEYWWLIQKPNEKGLSIAANVLKHGTGAINVDASRIGTDRITINRHEGYDSNSLNGSTIGKWAGKQEVVSGRWPANVLFDERAAELLDQQSGQFKGSIGRANRKSAGNYEASSYRVGVVTETEIKDFGGASRFFYVAKASKSERNRGLDKTDFIWEDDAWEKQDLKSALTATLQLAKDTSDDILVDDFTWSTDGFGSNITALCPTVTTSIIKTALKLITELKTSNASQSLSIRESIQDAIRALEATGSSLAESAASIGQLKLTTTNEKTASVLGVSRALLQTLQPIRDCAKSGNFHSTVKPIKLMEYLIRMITPPGGTVLDPFLGSGSTLVAAARLGFNGIGCEMSPEYLEIARRRIEHAQKQAPEQNELPLEGA